ncbi:MAG: hypothetical protein KKA79_04525 [Nanoarchaeota archaeon]|nr:hypothetical protein [Nanoarchaeota archaeon]
MYKVAFTQSWKDLKQNLILFIPDIIIVLFNLLLGLFFLQYSGILGAVKDPELWVEGLVTVLPAISSFVQQNIVRLIITFIAFALTSFVIGSGLTAMKYAMIKDLVKKKKLTIKKMFYYGKGVWNIIFMKIVMFAIGIIVLIFLSLFITGLSLIIYYFVKSKVIISLTNLALVSIIIIVLQMSFFFRYPIMFLDKKNPLKAVKDSLTYFLKHKNFVFKIWLIIALLYVLEVLLALLLRRLEFTIPVIGALTLVLGTLINITRNLWSEIFKFRTYKSNL